MPLTAVGPCFLPFHFLTPSTSSSSHLLTSSPSPPPPFPLGFGVAFNGSLVFAMQALRSTLKAVTRLTASAPIEVITATFIIITLVYFQLLHAIKGSEL